MEIKIKRVGYQTGTVGWLAAALEDGRVVLKEGVSKNGDHHGLWINGEINELLACHNYHGVKPGEYHGAVADSRYHVSEGDVDGWDARLTNAALAVLRKIAQQWCNLCNAERDADAATSADIRIVRVAAK